tara:strand:+ start:2184 stop:3110 length:927 start_codon:yes stop_codon:yes gene_type:complete
MYKVLISITSFSENSPIPKKIFQDNGIEIVENKSNKKLNETDLVNLSKDCYGIIAGTECISKKVIESSEKLRIISRVGIGVDNIDLDAAKINNVVVKNTPNIPAPYLAEMTIGIIITMLRKIHLSNIEMHKGMWSRNYGKSITDAVIGIIGYGKIGQSLVRKFESLHPKKILIYDISNKPSTISKNIEIVNFDDVLSSSDVITIHIPLTTKTKNLFNSNSINKMKRGSILINNSRGGIINEEDLYDALNEGKLSGAALDVFENEPYHGKLIGLDNCLLTSHIGSMSIECRNEMEIQSVMNIIDTLNNK